MKRFLLLLTLISTILLTPSLVRAQAGTPVAHGPWAVLDECADIRSSDLGAYKPSQVSFGPSGLQIVMTQTTTPCGYTNSENSPSTGSTTQPYLTGSVILSFLHYKPTAGHNIVVDIRAQYGRGWPANWHLGAGCQQTSKTTWDNFPPCNWASDSSDSAEIDLPGEGGPGSGHYTSMGQNVWVGPGGGSGTVLAGGCSQSMPGNANMTTGLHTYHMDWSTTTIHGGIDGTVGCTYTSGIPVNPMFLILENRQANGNQDNALPTTHTIQYVQICDAGNGTTCSTPGVNGGNTILFDDFNTPYTPPEVFFTDLTSGPNSGGENNNGTILTIYGRNFGATQGLSNVTIGGKEVAAYLQWGGRSKAGTAAAQLETISVAIGSGAVTGTVAVHTNQGDSICEDNKDTCQFTVRAGNIRCVSTAGNDANAGTFPSACWRTIPKADSTLAPGDIAYVQNGVNQTAIDNFNASVSIEGNSCTIPSPCALVVYPGATSIVGTTNTGFGMRTPATGGAKSNWTIAGFNISGITGLDLVSVDGWRVINNDFNCPNGNGQAACMHTDTVTQYRFYGNYTHNVGDTAGSIDKFYHGNYFTTNTNHVWMGWNEVRNNPNGVTTAGGCRSIQFFSTGGADQFDLHVHDNWIHDSICDGINFSTVNPDNGVVEAYNNVIYHVGTGPDPVNGSSDYACIVAGGGGTTPVQFYHNTMYDCGSRKAADSGVIFVGRAAAMWNNIAQQLSGEIYLTSSSAPGSLSGSNNIWNGGGTAPSQTTGNITSSPNFAVPGSDFTIPQSSPANGAGTVAHTTTWDFKGLVRPAPPALGAYEFAAGTVVGPIGTVSGLGRVTFSGRVVIN